MGTTRPSRKGTIKLDRNMNDMGTTRDALSKKSYKGHYKKNKKGTIGYESKTTAL